MGSVVENTTALMTDGARGGSCVVSTKKGVGDLRWCLRKNVFAKSFNVWRFKRVNARKETLVFQLKGDEFGSDAEAVFRGRSSKERDAVDELD